MTQDDSADRTEASNVQFGLLACHLKDVLTGRVLDGRGDRISVACGMKLIFSRKGLTRSTAVSQANPPR